MPASQKEKQQQVRRVLASLNIDYTEPNEDLFRFSLEGINSALIRVREQSVIFYALHETRVPKEFRSAVAEYIVRVNFALNFGNFELNFADGQIRYKLSIQAAQAEDISPPLKMCLSLSRDMYPRWAPGIAQICAGMSAEDAYRACKIGAVPSSNASSSISAVRDILRNVSAS